MLGLKATHCCKLSWSQAGRDETHCPLCCRDGIWEGDVNALPSPGPQRQDVCCEVRRGSRLPPSRGRECRGRCSLSPRSFPNRDFGLWLASHLLIFAFPGCVPQLSSLPTCQPLKGWGCLMQTSITVFPKMDQCTV